MNAAGILQNTDATLEKRMNAANSLLKSPELLKESIQIISNPQELSLKALMVIEVLSRENFEILQKYIPELIKSGKLYSDSPSRRCLAKIFNLTLDYDGRNNSVLSTELKKEIIRLSFLWLIAKEQTAVKVFSMQNIFDLRNEEEWIANELKAILEKDIMASSAGYKSRARKILRKL